MTLTVTDATKAVLCADGSEIIWYAEMILGPMCFLRVDDYSLGSGDTFTVSMISTAPVTVARTYTAHNTTMTPGSTFIRATSNSATARSMRDCIIGDTTINTYITAFVYETATAAVLVIMGRPSPNTAASAFPANTLTISSSDANAWTATAWSPIVRSYKFVSGQTAHEAGLIPEIASVSTVGATLDPYARGFQVGSVEIDLEDPDTQGVCRELMYRCFPKGRLVYLKYGTVGLSTSSFVPAGTYIIDEVIPRRGGITLTCVDPTASILYKDTDVVMTPVPSIAHIDPYVTAAGSGVIVYVTVVTASSQTLYTFTEGGDWSATGAQDSTLTALAARINTAMINTGVTCLPVFRNYATLREIILVPVTYVGGSIPGETSQPVAIKVRVAQPGSATLTIFESKSHAGSSIDFIGPFADGSFHPQYATPEVEGWIGMHPLSVIRRALRRSGLDSSLLDTSTFTPSNFTTISHLRNSSHDRHYLKGSLSDDFAQSNAPMQSSGKALPMADVVTEMCRIMQGGLVTDEAGTIKFKRRDTSAASVRHLTEDETADFEWTSMYDKSINRVSVIGTAFGDDANRQVWMYSLQDDFSVSAQSIVADTNRSEELITSRYLGTFCRCVNAYGADTLPNGSTTSITILGAWRSGFCGATTTSSGETTGAKAATAEPSSTRPCYILLWQPQSGAKEIVKSVGATGTANGLLEFDLAHNFPSETAHQTMAGSVIGTSGPLFMYDHWIYTVSRGALGTKAVNFGALGYNTLYACDITAAVLMADHALAFAFGLPVANFRTSMSHCDLQIGDAITHDNPQYLDFLMDGASSLTKWEIVGKEIDWPWCRYTIALLARDLAPPISVTQSYQPIPRVFPVISVLDVVTDNDDVPVTDSDGVQVTT